MARKKGRTSKTLVVPVRLDPVLKWAAELAAGKERRSLNSFVEWAVEKAVKDVMLARQYEDESRNVFVEVSAWDIAHECWHALPGLRLKTLAVRYPLAQTTKERQITDALDILTTIGGAGDGAWKAAEIYTNEKAWEAVEQFGADEISFEELTNAIESALSKEQKQP